MITESNIGVGLSLSAIIDYWLKLRYGLSHDSSHKESLRCKCSKYIIFKQFYGKFFTILCVFFTISAKKHELGAN